MTRAIHTLCAAALLLAATACEDTLQTAAPNPGNGPTITLCIDNDEEGAQTRTDLTNADPTNHVQSVRILIFQGGTEANNYNDATYVGEEDEEWPEETTRYEYTLNSAFVDGQTYTLLGIGMDDQFNTTYTIDQNTTLGKTYAQLIDGKTPAQCEFFTGTVTFTQTGKSTQIDDLHLRRRVAGVMLYVNEIPQELTETDGKYRVTSARLVLGAPQKSSVLLKRDFAKKDWREPDGQAQMSDDSKTLATIDFENNLTYSSGKDFYMDPETNEPDTAYVGVYMLPLNKTENTTFTVQLWGKKLEGNEPTGEETQLTKQFIVENRSEGNATAFDIRSNYIYCIGKRSPEQGIDAPISLSGQALYVEVQEWQKVETGHDFGPARVQAVFDDDEETIHNCMNEEFTINVLPPLETIRDKVESIRLMILHDETYALDDNGKEMLIKDDQKLAEELTAEERSIDYYKNWLYIKDPSITNEAEAYTTGLTLYTREGEYDDEDENRLKNLSVTFFIEDYARFRQWGWTQDGKWDGKAADVERINKDIRHCAVYLYTKIEGLDRERADTLDVQQYNTISIYYKDYDLDQLHDGNSDIHKDILLTENNSGLIKCGFSRLDLIDDENNIINDKERFQWGSGVTGDSYLIYSRGTAVQDGVGSKVSGARNILDIGDGYPNWSRWFELWNGSASQNAQHLFKRVDEIEGSGTVSFEMKQSVAPYTDNDKENLQIDECWYLPAQFEMKAFLEMSSSDNLNHNLKIDNLPQYWTSTGAGVGSEVQEKAIYYHIPDGSDNWEMGTGNMSGVYFRIRQARKFRDYTYIDHRNEDGDQTYKEWGW